MTTQEIKKYVSVADVWKKKYSDIKDSYDYIKQNSNFFEKKLKETQKLLSSAQLEIEDIKTGIKDNGKQIEIIDEQKKYIDVLNKKYKFVIKCLFISHVLLVLSVLYGIGII
jgi:uncharacterized protein YeeX (DUF496 family)